MSAAWEAAAKAWGNGGLGVGAATNFASGSNPFENFAQLFQQDVGAGIGAAPHLDAATHFKHFAKLLQTYAVMDGADGEGRAELGPLVVRMVRELRRQIAQNQALDIDLGEQVARWLGLFSHPILGPGRETHRRWRVVASAWQAHSSAVQTLHTAHVGIVDSALARFAARVEETSGEPITSLRGLFDEWIDCADGVYLDAARTPEFAKQYGATVNSAVVLRRAWSAWLNTMLDQFGVFDVGTLAGATSAAESARPSSIEFDLGNLSARGRRP